ncbi:LuxR family two component transcriptional regulator [Rhodopseudomonas faecalis]|uniref:LuxR family two component transcriptional regulator n=1 Tax=Rhodopseudomonas faecalis TaxID=99655 RepID=A0A318T8M7_9BRAD|nr:LuxR family two component transcriptional regulator [Rhodopseudomonas faecalis]
MSVILLIDEHGVYRSGLRELIEKKIERATVFEASGAERFATNHYYDLILVDAACLNFRVLELLKEALALRPETRFAVMSASNTRSDVLSCLSAGFHGFVHKLQSDDELLTAITDLLSGRIYVPRWLADGHGSLSDEPSALNIELETLRLTRRQNDILPLIAQGMSNKEISRHLNIAEGTTKIHTAALLRALGARNRTEAAFIAAKLIRSTTQTAPRFKSKRFLIKGMGSVRASSM